MTSANAPAVEAIGLVKRFGSTIAVDGIDLRVGRGMVYGFLGPNGAGKTTTIRILATLLRPDAGTARILGHDVVREASAVRGRIGLTGQFASVDLELTGLENLTLLARLWGYGRAGGRWRAGELLEAFGLAEARNRLVNTYSGGMRRRLDIAATVVVTPDVIFLDEPTTGLDPMSRNQVWDIVRDLTSAGTAVLLTTQNLDEADRLADRVAVIDHGKVIAEGSPGDLKAAVGSGVLSVRVAEPARRPDAERILAQRLGATVVLEAEATRLSARVIDPSRAPLALAELSAAGIALSDFALGQPSLDEVFLALTGHRQDEATTAAEVAA